MPRSATWGTTGGVEARLAPSRVPWAEGAPARGMARAHEEDVPLSHADADALLGLGPAEVVGEDVLPPGSSHGTPRTWGMSSRTPRPTRPFRSTRIDST